MKPDKQHIRDPLRWAILTFNVDQVTAEVTTAFNAAAIESILLKGPTIATWLYARDYPRLYTDSDLLIQRSDWSTAHRIMENLGFVADLAPLAHPRMESGTGYLWARPSDGAEVDLHFSLFGLGAEPQVIWGTLIRTAQIEPVGGVYVKTPSHAARLVHIALHAVQHGGEKQAKPMMDLERAVSIAPLSTWLEARQLAEQLDGMAAFAAGLALASAGIELAATMGIGSESSPMTTLRLEGVPMAEGFAELSDATGIRGKLALLVREAFPNATFMRWWTPLARRGPTGLAIAYVWRLMWLIYRAAPGYRAWRRATRG